MSRPTDFIYISVAILSFHPIDKTLFFFPIVCFTSYFVFSIAVLPHSPEVVYYHLLLRRETRITGVAPFSFRIGIWDLFVHRGQKSYTPTAFGKLWTTQGVRCMKHLARTPIKTHKGVEKWPLFVNKQLFWWSASITLDNNNAVLTDF